MVLRPDDPARRHRLHAVPGPGHHGRRRREHARRRRRDGRGEPHRVLRLRLRRHPGVPQRPPPGAVHGQEGDLRQQDRRPADAQDEAHRGRPLRRPRRLRRGRAPTARRRPGGHLPGGDDFAVLRDQGAQDRHRPLGRRRRRAHGPRDHVRLAAGVDEGPQEAPRPRQRARVDPRRRADRHHRRCGRGHQDASRRHGRAAPPAAPGLHRPLRRRARRLLDAGVAGRLGADAGGSQRHGREAAAGAHRQAGRQADRRRQGTAGRHEAQRRGRPRR